MLYHDPAGRMIGSCLNDSVDALQGLFDVLLTIAAHHAIDQYYAEVLYVNNTYQFSDYIRYDINMFPEEMKRKQRDEHFPLDLQNAYDLGKRLTEMAINE